MPKIDPNTTAGLEQSLEMVAEILRPPTPGGVERLVSIGKDVDRPAELRVAACCGLLDLAWSPPAEASQCTGAGAGPSDGGAVVMIAAHAMAEFKESETNE